MIRERDSEVSMVFLTGSDDYVLDGYRVFAAGYFIKPLAEHGEDFARTVSHIFPKIKERHKELHVRTGRIEFSVPYRNVRYVDITDRHHVCLHLVDQDVNVTMTYEDVCGVLAEDSRFVECHYRILVNMEYIRSMGKEEFVLKNGERIPISQRKQKETKAKYMHYLAHK